MTYAVELHNVIKKFGRNIVLNDFTMLVPEKKTYGFIGINGAGKTTTFGVLSGFLPYKRGSHSINGTFSTFPQDTKLFSGINVETQLRFFCELSKIPKKDIPDEIDRVLHLVNLTNYKKHKPEKLSHGMHKRIGIAQSFIGDPEIIFLDEPVSGLDPKNVFDIKNVIKKIGKEKTIVISSHVLTEISELCDVIGIIHNGKMQYEGPIEAITKARSIINFHLSNEIETTFVKKIKGIVDHSLKTTTNGTPYMLSITIDTKIITIENIIKEVIDHIYSRKCGVQQITLGESLEDSFLKMVS